VEATNMALLAEEFQADPEGSVSCLREVNGRKDTLMQEIHLLAGQKEQPVVLPPDRAAAPLQPHTPDVEASA
ncbi:MAG: hypothetical protein AB4042_19845, partial [Leptolyngbyaceae cyanobacterium]